MTPTEALADNATDTPAIDFALVEQFAGKIAGDQAVATNATLVYLGDKLGLWKALASVPSTTSDELAERTGLAERYLREWLSAQAAAGYVLYEPATGRFSLPVEHAAVLADDNSLASLIGTFEFTSAVWASTDRLAHAYATGDGIGWHEHDPRLFSAVERFFRPLYAASLVEEWIPSVSGLVEKLEDGARVLDVGCGFGTATLMMAAAYERSTFVGIDNHDESVRRARAAAGRSGAEARITFELADADAYAGEGYDVICFFDALHDMGNPMAALEQARAALAPGGIIFAVEPGASDKLEDNLHPLGLSWYAASSMVCLPGSLFQDGAAGLGAQAGPTRTLEVFTAAGLDARIAATTAYNLVIEARA